ncbi:MAG TPA: tetratricopeptide repeat protein, partial [Thermoanaerobaculia bacterium]|nr:tetratricopeptide repeat protein [Thermoanaerobaculia bacterium]
GHIAGCAGCRSRLAARLRAEETADDLRSSFEANVPRAAPARWWAAAAALIGAAAGAAWWAARGPASVSHASAAGEEVRVRAALRSGRLPFPGFVKELSPAPEVLMGEGSASAPPRLSPAGTGVLTGTPRFAWEAVPGVHAFRVRIFSIAGEPVAESPELAGPEWTPDRPLPPGKTYQWQIEGERGTDRITIPEPPAEPPRFRVIEPNAAARLRSLARARPAAHLLLAVEYARAGAVDEARTELQAASRENPSRADVRALLRSIDAASR